MIGCGAWGSAYLRTLTSMPEANLLYVCDKNEEIQRNVVSRFPSLSITGDYQTILKDSKVRAVFIATPPQTHFQIAADCIAAGKSVMVEKPTTTTTESTMELVQLAEKSGQVLMSGHQMIHHPTVECIRDHIYQGHFGDIKFMNFERTNCNIYRKDVNVLWDLAVHDLTIMFSLLASKPRWICARAVKWKDSLPLGIMSIDCGYANGTLVHIHTNWHHPKKIRRFYIIGTEMMAEFDDTRNADEKLIQVRPGSKPAKVKTAWEEPLRRQCKYFLQCVEKGQKPDPKGVDAVVLMRVMEAVEESIKTGNSVYL